MKKLTLQKITSYLLYLLIFLLPWQTRYIWHQGFIADGPWEYGTFSLYGTDIIILLIFITFLADFFKNKRGFSITQYSGVIPAKAGIQRLFILSILLLIIGSALASIWAIDKNVAFYGWIKLLQSLGLFIVILATKYKKSILYFSLLAAGFIQAIFGILQFWLHKSPASKWLGLAGLNSKTLGVSVIEYTAYVETLGREFVHRWLRAHGAFSHPNILAGFLFIVILAGIAIYLSKRYSLQKLLPMIAFLAIIPAFLLTFSRSGWLAFVFAILAIWVFILFRKSKDEEQKEQKADTIFSFSKFTFVICGISLITVLIYPNMFLQRFGTTQRLEKRSVVERMSSLDEFKVIIGKYWYKGTGKNNYTLALSPDLDSDIVKTMVSSDYKKHWYDYQPVHNIYLLILAEIGIIGLIGFLGIILSIFALFIKNIKALHKNYYAIASIIMLCGLLIIGLFDHYLWTLHSGILLFWIVTALAYKEILLCQKQNA